MAQFNWENDAAGFYRRYNLVFVAAAVLYLPIIFILQGWMKDRCPPPSCHRIRVSQRERVRQRERVTERESESERVRVRKRE